MTHRCISLRDWESRRLLGLAAGETAVLVRPVDARVPYVWEDRQGMPWPYDTTWSHGDDGEPWMTCPFGRPGDTLIGREAWASVWPGEDEVPLRECRIEYRADLPSGCLDGPGEWPPECKSDPAAPKWMSPVTMPAWAARHRLPLVGVEVKRCGALSAREMRSMGAKCSLDGYSQIGGTHCECMPCVSLRESAEKLSSHAWVLTVRKV